MLWCVWVRVGGARLKMAKNNFFPNITKLSGLVDIGLIECIPSLRERKWSEVDFFVP
jgi:hypothetical protein